MTFRFFKVHKKQKLSIITDGLELVNAWFIIIILTDILTVCGSIIKIYIDMKNLKVCCYSLILELPCKIIGNAHVRGKSIVEL